MTAPRRKVAPAKVGAKARAGAAARSATRGHSGPSREPMPARVAALIAATHLREVVERDNGAQAHGVRMVVERLLQRIDAVDELHRLTCVESLEPRLVSAMVSAQKQVSQLLREMGLPGDCDPDGGGF